MRSDGWSKAGIFLVHFFQLWTKTSSLTIIEWYFCNIKYIFVRLLIVPKVENMAQINLHNVITRAYWSSRNSNIKMSTVLRHQGESTGNWRSVCLPELKGPCYVASLTTRWMCKHLRGISGWQAGLTSESSFLLVLLWQSF
jgi:hypothetical protein